jgi:hypothetical protein
MNRIVWVIEMRCERGRLWHPVAAEPSLSLARKGHQEWQENNPDDIMRVVKYVPAR